MIRSKLVAILVVVAFAQVQAGPVISGDLKSPRTELSSAFADFCKAASEKVITEVKALKDDDDSNLFGGMIIQEHWDEIIDGYVNDKYETEESQHNAFIHSCNRVKSYYDEVNQMFNAAKESISITSVPERVRLGDFSCPIVERLKDKHEWCVMALQIDLDLANLKRTRTD